MSRTKTKMAFLKGSASLFQTFTGAFIDVGTRLRTRHTLNALDDRMLKDIGIARCEINRIASEKAR